MVLAGDLLLIWYRSLIACALFSKLLSAESILDMICFDRVGKKNENPVRFSVKELAL
jgi:hypothetical protein